MKKSDVRELRDIVRTLCKELEETPWAIVRMETLMFGLIELARTKKPWLAVDVALTVQEELLKLAEAGVDAHREQKRGSSIGIGTVAPTWAPTWWKATEVDIRTTQPSVTGYVGVNHDAPRPAATVEQMRAAADAAMAHDEEMDEYACDSCHKSTLVPMDSGTPKGWQPSGNPDGEEYICNECHTFGGKP
jgi:hypothetical protein